MTVGENFWLSHAEQFAYLLNVGGVNETHVAEVALLLLRLFGENVAVESVLSLDLTRSGECETLLRAGISLYLRHLLCD